MRVVTQSKVDWVPCVALLAFIFFTAVHCQRKVEPEGPGVGANADQDAGESLEGGRMDALAVPTPSTEASAAGSGSPQTDPKASASPQDDPYYRRVVSHDGRLV